MATKYSVQDRIAVIELDKPPANGLGLAVRTGIVEHLGAALADPEVDAIVLTGRPGMFSAGADITEFGTPKALTAPALPDVIEALEAADKPVIAAIDGACLGGGLELALGAHYRIASPGSKLGLPEVTLGLIPGAGGTQRLPRAIGTAAAAELITAGAHRTATQLAAIPGQRLLDRVADGDLLAAARTFAHEVAAARPLPRLRDLRSDFADLTALREKLTRRSRGLAAPLAALDLVGAPDTPIEDALLAERAVFTELLAGPQSAAMRHAFFAERAARKVDGLGTDVTGRPVHRVGVLGAGTMGGGIAMNFLNTGIPVTIVETSREALDRGLGVIEKNYRGQVDRGRLDAAELDRRMALLTPSLDFADLAGADLVIEAVYEDMAVKLDVFARLDAVVKPGAVLASNTSTLDLDRIAAATSRPADVVGMHFFSPANVMKLLEVVRGAATADDVLLTALETGRRIGKTAVVSGVCDGFIGNRMLYAYRRAAQDLLEAGASPERIDAAVEGFGFAMGPFKVGDLAGNDIGWAVRKRRYAEHPDTPREEISDALCELGRFGQKTGAGWYDYPDGGRTPVPSPVVADLLAGHWQRLGVTPTEFDPAEIVRRLVFALTDEGARILAEGIAQRASDIDVVYLAGYGFPRHHGGPMFHADQTGLTEVAATLRRYGRSPAPLLESLATKGKTFN